MEEMRTEMYDNPHQINEEPAVPPIKIGEWIWSIILMGLPLINIAVLLIWAFGGTTNQNKSNWAKANLILMVIGTVFYVLFLVVFGAAMYEILGEF